MYTAKNILTTTHKNNKKEKEKHGIVLHEIKKIKMLLFFFFEIKKIKK